MLAYMGPDGGRAGARDRAGEMGRRPAPAPSLEKTRMSRPSATARNQRSSGGNQRSSGGGATRVL